jgi:hypothetical protein
VFGDGEQRVGAGRTWGEDEHERTSFRFERQFDGKTNRDAAQQREYS